MCPEALAAAAEAAEPICGVGQSLSLQGSCLQGGPWLSPRSKSGLGFPFCLDPPPCCPCLWSGQTWWALTRGRDGREGCWVEAAENVLRLGLGYHEDRGLGTWRCGGTQVGGTEGGLQLSGPSEASAVMEGRERFGAWVGAALQSLAEDMWAP